MSTPSSGDQAIEQVVRMSSFGGAFFGQLPNDAIRDLAGPNSLYKCLDYLGLITRAYSATESLECGTEFHSFLVWTVDRHRVEGVCDRDDLCLERYLIAR